MSVYEPAYVNGGGKLVTLSGYNIVPPNVVDTVTAGTGISVNNSTGAVTVTNTGVTSITAGTGINASASTGSVTLSNTLQGSLVTGNNVTFSTGVTPGSITTPYYYMITGGIKTIQVKGFQIAPTSGTFASIVLPSSNVFPTALTPSINPNTMSGGSGQGTTAGAVYCYQFSGGTTTPITASATVTPDNTNKLLLNLYFPGGLSVSNPAVIQVMDFVISYF